MKIFTTLLTLGVFAFLAMACQSKSSVKKEPQPESEPNRAPADTFRGRVYYNESKPVESHPAVLVPNESSK